MSPSNSPSHDPEKATEGSRVLTPEKLAELRERAAKLMTPEEHARLLNKLHDTAAKIVAACEILLESKKP